MPMPMEFLCCCREATVTHGIRVQSIGGMTGLKTAGEENLGYWTDKRGTISWTLHSKNEERVAVTIRLSAEAASTGSKIELACGEQMMPIDVRSTGDWERFTDVPAGTLSLPAGVSTITLSAKSVKGIAPCNIASVKLSP